MSMMAVTSTVAGAQLSKDPQVSKPAAPAGTRACTMVEHVLMMQVVDRNGTPITDATIVVKNLRTRTAVEHAQALGSGDYRIYDDSGVNSVSRAGDPFDVLVTYGSRSRHVGVNIGTDADGCHVRFIRVPGKIVL
jgi:hypothetical protein